MSTILALYTTNKVWRTQDLGETWENIATGGTSFQDLVGATRSDGSGRIIGADSGFGAFYSDDGGATWTTVAAPDMGGGSVQGVATDHAGNWLIAGTDSNLWPCYWYSNDDGLTWNVKRVQTAPAFQGNTAYSVAYDSIHDRFFIGVNDGNVFKTDDAGATFSPAGFSDETNFNLWWIPVYDRLIGGRSYYHPWTLNEGASWVDSPLVTDFDKAVFFAAKPDGSVLLVSGQDSGPGGDDAETHVGKSVNGGDTWTAHQFASNLGTPEKLIHNMAWDAANEHWVALVHVTGDGTYRLAVSEDDGETWTLKAGSFPRSFYVHGFVLIPEETLVPFWTDYRQARETLS